MTFEEYKAGLRKKKYVENYPNDAFEEYKKQLRIANGTDQRSPTVFDKYKAKYSGWTDTDDYKQARIEAYKKRQQEAQKKLGINPVTLQPEMNPGSSASKTMAGAISRMVENNTQESVAKRKYADSLLPDLIKQKQDVDKRLNLTKTDGFNREIATSNGQKERDSLESRSSELQSQLNELLYLKYGNKSAVESRINALKRLQKAETDKNIKQQYSDELSVLNTSKDGVGEIDDSARKSAALKRYSGLSQNRDFEEKSSQNIEAANADLQTHLDLEKGSLYNRNFLITAYNSEQAKSEGKSAYGNISEDEAKTYRYIWNTQGSEAANKYLSDTELIRGKAAAERETKVYEKFADKYPRLGSAASVLSLIHI